MLDEELVPQRSISNVVLCFKMLMEKREVQLKSTGDQFSDPLALPEALPDVFARRDVTCCSRNRGRVKCFFREVR